MPRHIREEALLNQCRAWSLRMEGRSYSQIAEALGVSPPSVHDMLRREFDRLQAEGGHEKELESFYRQTKAGQQEKIQERRREAAALRQSRDRVLNRVSMTSFYLPGQLVEVLGGYGDEGGGLVRVRSQRTRGEYFIPRPFLMPM